MPSDAPHQIEAGGRPMLVLYVEPQSDEYLALRGLGEGGSTVQSLACPVLD